MRALPAPSTAFASALSSPMSAPAANALVPAPVTMTTRTSSSCSSAESADESSVSNDALSAFKTDGRLSVTTATGPSVSTRICSNVLVCIIVEALSALAAEAAGEHHAFEQRGRRHHRILEFVKHDLRDVIRRVEADEIEQLQRPHRVAASQFHAHVDVFFAGQAFVVYFDRVEQVRDEQTVHDETGRIFRENRLFAEFAREVEKRIDNVLRRRNRLDHFHEFHDRNGIEEVQARDAVRTLGFGGEFDDAQARRIRADDAVRREQVVELPEKVGLRLDVLDDRLDDEIAILKVVKVCRRTNAAEDGVALRKCHFLLFDELVERFGDAADAAL